MIKIVSAGESEATDYFESSGWSYRGIKDTATDWITGKVEKIQWAKGYNYETEMASSFVYITKKVENGKIYKIDVQFTDNNKYLQFLKSVKDALYKKLSSETADSSIVTTYRKADILIKFISLISENGRNAYVVQLMNVKEQWSGYVFKPTPKDNKP